MKDKYKAGLGLFVVLTFCIGAAENKHAQESSTKTNLLTPITCSGDIYLSSQAQVDSFPSTYSCTEISGTLTISGNDITNLDSLYLVTKVDMDLNVINNPNLTNLKGLSGLTYVGASLDIQRGAHLTNNPNLNDLDGLNKLASIAGMLEISDNAKLTNLDALSALTSIASTPTSQSLRLVNNPSLTSLIGLHSITSLPGQVDIENNSVLPNLNGLDSVALIHGDLIVSGNNSLANVNGFGKVASISGGVQIMNNMALTSLDGFSSLKSIGYNNQTNLGLNISGNASLVSLKGLRSITSVNRPVYIVNNAALPNLDGLESLASVSGNPGGLTVSGNTSLTNVNGLSSLSFASQGITISDNPALTDLNGLSSLTQIQGSISASIVISNNASLTNVDSLSSLTDVEGANRVLTVTGNPQLVKCCGLYNLLKSPSMNCSYGCSHIAISGNGAGCTRDDILAAGPCPVVCNGTITLRSQAQVDAFHSTYPCNEIAGSLYVSGDDITNLDSLHFVTKITGLLEISYNATLTNLDGLSSLQSIGAPPPVNNSLIITNNPALVSLNGLRSITSLSGSVTITFNSSLPNLHGLESLTKVADVQGDGAWVKITDNTSLSNIDALSALTDVTGKYVGISIVNNPSLLNLNGLSSLTQIAGSFAVLEISSNTSLSNVDGLSSLKKIGSGVTASLIIKDNTALTNVDGLSSLTQIRGTNASSLGVTGNTQLARCCGLYNVLSDMTSSSCSCYPSITISGNGAGCTQDDILASGPCCTSPGGCPPPEPTAQPTNLTFANVNDTSMAVSFTSPSPSPNGFVTLMRSSSSPYPNDVPVDGNVYLVGDVIGNSSVVGFGNATTFTATNLSASTVYYFDVFSYNGTNYLSVNPLGGSQRTADVSSGTAQPTNMIFSAVTDTTMTVSFTAARPTPGGYITLMQAFGTPYPDDAPVDGTTYQTGDVIGSSTIVINVGSETSLDVIYLSPGVDYYFDTFSYTISNGVYHYITSDPLEGNQSTTSSGSPSARIASGHVAKSTANSSEPISNTRPFPNPFSENTTIPFTTNNQNAFVQIAVYDFTGRKISDIVSQNFARGYHEAKWWGTDNLGNKVSQGIYIYRIRTSETNQEIAGLLVAK